MKLRTPFPFLPPSLSRLEVFVQKRDFLRPDIKCFLSPLKGVNPFPKWRSSVEYFKPTSILMIIETDFLPFPPPLAMMKYSIFLTKAFQGAGELSDRSGPPFVHRWVEVDSNLRLDVIPNNKGLCSGL